MMPNMEQMHEQLLNEIQNLKQMIQKLQTKQEDQEKLIQDQQKEIEELKSINRIKEKNTCYLTYFSQTGERQALLPIKANEDTNLPIFYILPDDNEICRIESHSDGTKIYFKQDGTYHIFFSFRIEKIDSETRIEVNTTNRHSHCLMYATQLPKCSKEISIIGENFIDIAANDFIYVTIKSSNAIKLLGNNSKSSSIGISRFGDRHCTYVNGYTQEVKPSYDH